MSRAKNKHQKRSPDSDIIIPIMGPTGAGKSSFISLAAGGDVARVGHSLESCTTEMQAIPIPYHRDPARRVVLVDTPGFDDTFLSDTEILKRIADWLEKSYKQGKKLSGIIYLHEITQKRMSGSLRKNYMMFGKLCGKKAARNIVLSSTKWGLVERGMGEIREKQLSNFWADLLRQGARMDRFLGTPESAWEIIDSIVDREPINDVLIQQELVILLKFLPETEAGLTLRLTLQELLESHRRMAQDLQNGPNDEHARQRHADIQERLQNTAAQIQELKIPVSMRMRRFLGLH